jgi:hypothetical protein
MVSARLDEPVGQRVARSPYGFGFILAEDGTLLGRLRKAAWRATRMRSPKT